MLKYNTNKILILILLTNTYILFFLNNKILFADSLPIFKDDSKLTSTFNENVKNNSIINKTVPIENIGENSKNMTDKFIGALIDKVSEQHKYSGWLELSIMILTAAILAATLLLIYVLPLLLKETRAHGNRIDEKLKEIDPRMREYQEVLEKMMHQTNQNIEFRINSLLYNELENIVEKFSDQIRKRIENYLEQEDFTKLLEERYLSMEYVSLGIWQKISSLVYQALRNQDYDEVIRLWGKLYATQLALRQLLSPKVTDIYTGMGTLRSIADEKLIPIEPLWSLICLLNEQERLNGKNYEFACDLGKENGKTFNDCEKS
jgi:hypothetical protein